MNAFDSIVAKFMGSRSDRELKSYRPLVDKINGLEAKMEACSDEQLAAFTAEFRQRIENGEPLDSLIPETFAVVREVGKRTLEHASLRRAASGRHGASPRERRGDEDR